MVRKTFALAVLASCVCFSAHADPGPGVTGNDTGGIIPYSPANRVLVRDIAAAHCASYGKAFRITSVYAKYGQYIGFSCYFDPRVAWQWSFRGWPF